ncbi:MAG: hypothetical protein MMC23_005130 [Stictis urceolatum]|nr:hypothetical protein [Stictis urceolata]
MKEAIVRKNIVVDIIDSPVPTPNNDQVVIKVVISGSNPKDWKTVEWSGKELNNGDDIAGTVHSVGSNVTEFKPGDRVAAFHEMREPGGSYAEYAIAYAHATFHLPEKTSYEGISPPLLSFPTPPPLLQEFANIDPEASTIPLAAMTAALGLYKRLSLSPPSSPTTSPTPLIIYGAASAVGAFGVKLAAQSNIHPLLCVAGRGIPFVKSLPGFDPSKGDAVIDYRAGDEAVVSGLKEALKNSGLEKVEYALDATSEHGSYENIGRVIDPQGALTGVLPGKGGSMEKPNYQGVPEGLRVSMTMVGSVFGTDKEFGREYFRFFAKGLGDGSFTGHPFEIREGGLAGVQGALRDLKEGKASATKYVFRIEETEGYGADNIAA